MSVNFNTASTSLNHVETRVVITTHSYIRFVGNTARSSAWFGNTAALATETHTT